MNISVDHDETSGTLTLYGSIPDLTGTAKVVLHRIAASSTYSADHTLVPESMAGRGVGTQLLESLIDYARDHQLHIVPVCSFVVHQANKHPDWSDVIVSAA